jgi:hypothetical protein
MSDSYHAGRHVAGVAPTVVRVIAEDEFGTTIGRNFVEVDQGRTGPGYVAHK